MSFKSKDLAYNAKEPAFLQRIRGYQSGTGVDSDRHERPIARPRGAARATNDDDDAPTYIVEDSNTTLSKEEYEALLKKEQGPDPEAEKDQSVQDKFAESSGISAKQEGSAGEVPAEEEEAKSRTKQEVTEVGGQQKKRKAARVVGVAGDEESYGVENDEVEFKRVKQVKKKKVKPVKLSFDGE